MPFFRLFAWRASSLPTASSSRRCASIRPTTAVPTTGTSMHLGMLANSGAALVVVEATHVERHGRITHGCLGLYSDDNEAALARVVAQARRMGTAKIRHPDRPFRPQGLGAASLGRRLGPSSRRLIRGRPLPPRQFRLVRAGTHRARSLKRTWNACGRHLSPRCSARCASDLMKSNCIWRTAI